MLARLVSLVGLVALGAVAGLASPYPASADPIAVGEEHCVINVRSDDVLNFRQQATANSPVVGQRAYATCGVRVIGECYGSWCPAEEGHFAGWVNRHYLGMVSPALYCVSGVAAYDRLNVRAYPSTQSTVLVQLAPNQCDIAFLPYRVNNWQKIRVAGWEGWASLTYLSGQ